MKVLERSWLIDNFFTPYDGVITQYYGRIGQGKTYAATADILKLLNRGQIVYCNWYIDWNGYDEADQLKSWILAILGLKKVFLKHPASNLRYIALDDEFIDKFERLTNCHVFLDEGHLVLDSYQMAKMSLRKRAAILHTRHFDRSIAIISQRPTAVHISARSQVNLFYKCEKLISWPFVLFRRTTYEDLVNENVDEERSSGKRFYIGKASIYNAYNSKYMRKDAADMYPDIEGYKIEYREIAVEFARFVARRRLQASSRSVKLLNNGKVTAINKGFSPVGVKAGYSGVKESVAGSKLDTSVDSQKDLFTD